MMMVEDIPVLTISDNNPVAVLSARLVVQSFGRCIKLAQTWMVMTVLPEDNSLNVTESSDRRICFGLRISHPRAERTGSTTMASTSWALRSIARRIVGRRSFSVS